MTFKILPFKSYQPDIASDVFIAPGAVIIGDVHIKQNASIWYNAVLRGDVGTITIGSYTNIQDQCMLHTTTGKSQCIVKNHVTVGHRAVLHGCLVNDYALIGMGAILLDNASVGHHAIVAAGSVVLENTVIPPYTLWAGVPAKQVKVLEPNNVDDLLAKSAMHYSEYASQHKKINEND